MKDGVVLLPPFVMETISGRHSASGWFGSAGSSALFCSGLLRSPYVPTGAGTTPATTHLCIIDGVPKHLEQGPRHCGGDERALENATRSNRVR